MRHPRVSFRSSISSLPPAWKRQSCRRLRCWWCDNGDWGNVRVSPLLYSYCSWVTKESSVVVRSLPSLARTLPGRRVCEETRSAHSSPLVTSGNSNSPRTCSQVATHPKVCYHTMVSNRNYILYKTRKFGGLWLLLYKRGIWFSIKIYRYMKIRSWYQKYGTSPFSGHVFHMVKNMWIHRIFLYFM